MKYFVTLIFLCCSIILAAQFPANPRKQLLGYQTTGQGLVTLSNGAPTHTPDSLDNSWMTLDTTGQKIYFWNELTDAWDTINTSSIWLGTELPDGNVLIDANSNNFIIDTLTSLSFTADGFLQLNKRGTTGYLLLSAPDDEIRIEGEDIYINGDTLINMVTDTGDIFIDAFVGSLFLDASDSIKVADNYYLVTDTALWNSVMFWDSSEAPRFITLDTLSSYLGSTWLATELPLGDVDISTTNGLSLSNSGASAELKYFGLYAYSNGSDYSGMFPAGIEVYGDRYSGSGSGALLQVFGSSDTEPTYRPTLLFDRFKNNTGFGDFDPIEEDWVIGSIHFRQDPAARIRARAVENWSTSFASHAAKLEFNTARIGVTGSNIDSTRMTIHDDGFIGLSNYDEAEKYVVLDSVLTYNKLDKKIYLTAINDISVNDTVWLSTELPLYDISIDADAHRFDVSNLERTFWEYFDLGVNTDYTYVLVDPDLFFINSDSDEGNNLVLSAGHDATGEPQFQVQLSNNVSSSSVFIDAKTDENGAGDTYFSVDVANSLSDTTKLKLLLGDDYDEGTRRFSIAQGYNPSQDWATLYRWLDIQSSAGKSNDGVSLYDDSYQLPNDLPDTTSNVMSEMVWVGNGTATDAHLLPKPRGELYVELSDPDTVAIISGTPDSLTSDNIPGINIDFEVEGSRLVYKGSIARYVTVNYDMSVTYSAGNQTLFIYTYKNGTELTKASAERKIGAGGDIGRASGGCFTMMNPNDYIQLYFDASTNGSVIINSLNLRIE